MTNSGGILDQLAHNPDLNQQFSPSIKELIGCFVNLTHLCIITVHNYFSVLEGIQFFIKLIFLYCGLNFSLQGSRHGARGWLDLQTPATSEPCSEALSTIPQQAWQIHHLGCFNSFFPFHFSFFLFNFILFYHELSIGLLIAMLHLVFLRSISASLYFS